MQIHNEHIQLKVSALIGFVEWNAINRRTKYEDCDWFFDKDYFETFS